ncbi:MAG: DUF523 domain-containing protein [Clostridia bacterium]|nr:DUF523 domain-containing protein [Clostridia bacterium]
MAKIIVSGCLLGCDCRYKGDNCRCDELLDLAKDHTLIPVCPEQLGGLSTPRDPAEIVGDKVISNHGKDVTYEYNKGAELALYIAKVNNADAVALKANSPSCGKGIIYDGTFTGNKIEGNGIAAKMFLDAGFSVFTENEIPELKKFLNE